MNLIVISTFIAAVVTCNRQDHVERPRTNGHGGNGFNTIDYDHKVFGTKGPSKGSTGANGKNDELVDANSHFKNGQVGTNLDNKICTNNNDNSDISVGVNSYSINVNMNAKGDSKEYGGANNIPIDSDRFDTKKRNKGVGDGISDSKNGDVGAKNRSNNRNRSVKNHIKNERFFSNAYAINGYATNDIINGHSTGFAHQEPIMKYDGVKGIQQFVIPTDFSKSHWNYSNQNIAPNHGLSDAGYGQDTSRGSGEKNEPSRDSQGSKKLEFDYLQPDTKLYDQNGHSALIVKQTRPSAKTFDQPNVFEKAPKAGFQHPWFPSTQRLYLSPKIEMSPENSDIFVENFE